MTDEERTNWALILTPAGEQWSGRARYAAAMYFHRRGEMSEEVLEIYRICARLDHEDAVDALRAYRMGDDWISRVGRMRALGAGSEVADETIGRPGHAGAKTTEA